jgi:hypothetical protein
VSAGLTDIRAAHMARAQQLAPEFIARLGWDAATLAAHRREALRRLVATAVARSPWHRKRLHQVDLDALDPEDLSALPVMTKAEVMADFDDVVTDERLRLADVEAYLARGDDGYLFDEYTPMTTGGSSGRRGVFVFDRDGLAYWWLSFFRRLLIDRQSDPALADGPVTVGRIRAGRAGRTTLRGVAVDVCGAQPLELTALTADLSARLARAGLASPQVIVHQVDRVTKTVHTGKIKRFVPLAGESR